MIAAAVDWVGDSGNVGIGTTTPEAKLDVAGNLRVVGGITEQLSIIQVGPNPPEWDTANSKIYQFFKDNLKGKPKGTMIKAISEGKWDGHCWVGWVGANNSIYYLPIHDRATNAGSVNQ